MDALVHILTTMRGKQGMYVGDSSIEHLYLYLLGFRTALWMHRVSHEDRFMPEFQQFIAHKYSDSSTGSWARIIQENSSSPELAMEKFWELFDEYQMCPSGNSLES